MKTILTAAVALSIVASAGAASAAQYDRDGGRGSDRRVEQNHRQADKFERKADKFERKADRAQDRADSFERRADRRYAAARYQRPNGYQQRRWTRGERLPAQYRARPYVVDYRAYHLAPPPRGYQYTRVDNDVLLTAIATGVIASAITGLFQ